MRFMILILCLLQVPFQLWAQTTSHSTTDERGLRREFPASYSRYVDRWAIIVGISKYKDESLNLEYARRDAEALYELIQKPSGGGFEKDHIVKLVDEEATTANITRALRSFLKKPDKGDIVLIYFACHGAPDLDRPNIVYLLTHDTEPDDIAGTALPMREIDLSLRENLLAERVVILADTCHSAAIGGGIGRRAVQNRAAVVNRYLQNVGKTKGGIALLTSAASRETAREGKEWAREGEEEGSGHGVFTYYILEGMEGKADNAPKNGIVTVGELFEYVRGNVMKETNNQQHPTIGTNPFDPKLPMAVTGGITAQEHFQLGRRLYQLGWLLDDKGRFESANGQFYEAQRLMRLEGVPFPEVSLQRGLSLMALGRLDEAISEFKKAIKQDTAQEMPEASFYLGIAYAKQKDYQAAVNAFETFLKQRPQDENAPWVKEYVGWLNEKQSGEEIPAKYALLIGIGQYPDNIGEYTPAHKYEVPLMKSVLMEKYGFQESNIVTLLDEKATRQGILDEFDHLINQVKPNDVVIVYFLGKSRESSEEFFLFPHDVIIPDQHRPREFSNSISAVEFHSLLVQIPTLHKTCIIDSSGGEQLLNLAKESASYALIMGASPHEGHLFENEYDEYYGESVSIFTYHFVQQLRKSSPEATYGDIADAVADAVKKHIANTTAINGYGKTVPANRLFSLTPQFIGDKWKILFTGVVEPYLTFFDLSLRKNYDALTQEYLNRRYYLFLNQILPFPKASYSLGRAYLEKGSYLQAIETLQAALKQSNGDFPEAVLALGIAQAEAQRSAEAQASFQAYLSSVDSSTPTIQMQTLITQIESFVRAREHAVLVGIDDYISPEIPDLRGAENDVVALKRVLLDKFDFQESNVKVLLNHQATRQAILQAFQQLVERTNQGELAVFYFAGNSSESKEPTIDTIVPADGRQTGIFDITRSELSSLIPNQNANFITIIDASNIPTDERQRQNERGFIDRYSKEELRRKKMGLISIYSGGLRLLFGGRSEIDLDLTNLQGSTGYGIHGDLTYALIQSLAEADSRQLTYRKLFELTHDKMRKKSGKLTILDNNLEEFIVHVKAVDLKSVEDSYSKPIIFGDTSEKVFSCAQGEFANHLMSILRNAERVEILDHLIKILPRVIERRNNNYPEGYLNLGIAYAAKGEYDKGIKALETAIVQRENNYPEARCHLGRVLFESGRDLERAVSELRQATEQEPDNVPAYYYLGQAIRALVEQEFLTEAQKALQNYLEKGAPLGHRKEVLEFLNSAKPSAETSKKGGRQESSAAKR